MKWQPVIIQSPKQVKTKINNREYGEKIDYPFPWIFEPGINPDYDPSNNGKNQKSIQQISQRKW
jgi:hypothetical protein